MIDQSVPDNFPHPRRPCMNLRLTFAAALLAASAAQAQTTVS